jgi:hypothetical protein
LLISLCPLTKGRFRKPLNYTAALIIFQAAIINNSIFFLLFLPTAPKSIVELLLKVAGNRYAPASCWHWRKKAPFNKELYGTVYALGQGVFLVIK